MTLLPVFLKLEGRRCLLVGAGSIALSKAQSLLHAGARMRVVAPQARPEFQQLAQQGKLEWLQREFTSTDLDGNLLVVAATNSASVNAAVYQAAVERGIIANSVDDIPNCDFFFGSIVSRGHLQIAISTAGESPAFAQQLRREIDEQLPNDLGPWLETLGQLRREVLATHPPGEPRRLLLHQLAQRELCSSTHCPTRQLAQAPLHNEAQNAKVYLVGAGPGDPELLTVKALRLIQSANVILHDDLVAPAILRLAAPTAEIVNVGKRCGVKSITQDEINQLLIDRARSCGKVIRLKGGDPMLFGRATEEIAALVASGIDVEVVPGITAAFAAAAALGCSLTDRASASSVLLTTGHHAHLREGASEEREFSAQKREEPTRVVYMPGRDLRQLAQQWIAEGFSPDLPCALVSRAAQPGQQIQWATLATLGDAEALQAPSLLIAGWAIRQIAAPIANEAQPEPCLIQTA